MLLLARPSKLSSPDVASAHSRSHRSVSSIHSAPTAHSPPLPVLLTFSITGGTMPAAAAAAHLLHRRGHPPRPSPAWWRRTLPLPALLRPPRADVVPLLLLCAHACSSCRYSPSPSQRPPAAAFSSTAMPHLGPPGVARSCTYAYDTIQFMPSARKGCQRHCSPSLDRVAVATGDAVFQVF